MGDAKNAIRGGYSHGEEEEERFKK